VGQSLGDHLVLASTVKLVRGGRASAALDPSSDLLDQGDDLTLTRETHATRSMLYLWTGEIANELQGYRVVGTGDRGNFKIPASMAKHYPAVFHLRLFGMNANGKVYSADRTYQLTQ